MSTCRALFRAPESHFPVYFLAGSASGGLEAACWAALKLRRRKVRSTGLQAASDVQVEGLLYLTKRTLTSMT